mgnify:CR=1 FL=1
MRLRIRWDWLRALALVLVAVSAGPFVAHALGLGWQGLRQGVVEDAHVFATGRWAPNLSMALHMWAGAVITALAPLQMVGPVRRRWPRVHRAAGHAVIATALISGLAGLIYIALRRTVGGLPMDVAFATYGALVIWAALMTLRHARTGDRLRHRNWGLRMFVLAIGSLVYRIHYGLWFLATGGAGVEEGFTGAFDLVNLWAFFIPYLLAVELWIRTTAPPPTRATA